MIVFFKYIVPFFVFFVIVVGSIIDSKNAKFTRNHKIISCFSVGFALIVSYVLYAVITTDIPVADILLLRSDPEEVNNIWGERNLFYSVPMGYAFIVGGFF